MNGRADRVAVLGASGRVGSCLVEYALEAGYHVTAVVRDAGKLRARTNDAGAARLRVVTADVLDAQSVAAVLHDADVVLSALAAPSLEHPGTVLSQGMRNIVAALDSARRSAGDAPPAAARVLCIAGAGVLPLSPDAGAALTLDSPDFPEMYRAMSREHAAAWRVLRDSSLRWTVVCPTDMPSGARTGVYRTAVERIPEGGTSVSAEDVADFMVREVADARFERVRVGISY